MRFVLNSTINYGLKTEAEVEFFKSLKPQIPSVLIRKDDLVT